MVERGAFGYFTSGPWWLHLGVLVAGFGAWPLAYLGTRSVVGGGGSVLAASTVAAVASGGYYGVAYMAARGAPMGNFVLPGLAMDIGHGMLTSATGIVYARSFDGWFGPLIGYLSLVGCVWIWHSYLGERRAKWVETHFPPAFVELVNEARNE